MHPAHRHIAHPWLRLCLHPKAGLGTTLEQGDGRAQTHLTGHRDTWLLLVALCGSQVQEDHLRPQSLEDTMLQRTAKSWVAASLCPAAGSCHPQGTHAPWGDTQCQP